MDAATIWGLIITIVGTIASIWGAFVSFKQAKDASASAIKAEEVRGQLINLRKSSELAELKMYCERALKVMEKYGPAAAPSSLAGVDTNSDAKDVQTLITQSTMYEEFFKNKEIDFFKEKVTPLLISFVDPSQKSYSQTNGREILKEVTTFSAAVKKVYNNNRESTLEV